MLATKRSTASIWARNSRSSRWVSTRERPRQVLVERGELEGALDDRRRRAAEHAVDRGAEQAVGDAGQRAHRRHDPHLPEVERARHERDRVDRQRLVAGERQQRHDPAQAPADERDRRPAGVGADAAHRGRDDVLAPSARGRGRGRRRRCRRTRAGRSGARARAGARPASSRGAGRSRSSARPAAGPAAPAARAARGRRGPGSGRRPAAGPRR